MVSSINRFSFKFLLWNCHRWESGADAIMCPARSLPGGEASFLPAPGVLVAAGFQLRDALGSRDPPSQACAPFRRAAHVLCLLNKGDKNLARASVRDNPEGPSWSPGGRLSSCCNHINFSPSPSCLPSSLQMSPQRARPRKHLLTADLQPRGSFLGNSPCQKPHVHMCVYF